MGHILLRVRGCLALTIACCCIACASPADAEGTVGQVDHVLAPPDLAGWKTAPPDQDYRFPRLSPLRLQSEDGAVDVDIGMRVLALGRQVKDHVGAIPVDEWLPKNRRWLPVGQKAQQCFWQDSLSTAGSKQRIFSGQARCRRPNFLLIFNMFSRLDRRSSDAMWKNAFARIVLGTQTTARCLSPEEMTFLTDYEGPPFASRSVDPNTIIVAAAPMCGSGGCKCFRYERKVGCFQLVLPPFHCDDELRRIP